MRIICKPSTAHQNSVSTDSFKTHTLPRVSAANVLILAVTLTVVFLFSLPHALPHVTASLTASRYRKCGHIVLVSCQRHGSTWFISNAEDCTSANGSFGNLTSMVEIWHHGKVKNITLQGSIDLVRFNTSVKIMPRALYNQHENVKEFFEAMRAMEVPVFVLRRQLDQSFASLQAAWRTKMWVTDNGGAVVEREFKDGNKFQRYKNTTETYFHDAKTLMREVGIVWDEVEYENILSQRLIVGENAKCYIRNCNF